MNIKQAKEEIKNTVLAYLKKDEDGNYRIPSIRQRPILLMGPPGIGKTQIMEQIARECQIGLVSYTITHHTRQSAVGLPFIVEEDYDGETMSVTQYTMSEIIASIYRKMKDTGLKQGILFIDEINCVSETLAPTMLQFLQCKTFGNQAVPSGWIIAAAGNPPEYNKSVREFDMVTLDRVRRIHVEADYRVWKEYAARQGVHGAILGYLELHPRNFYRVQNDVDGMQFVTARGWEDLSTLLTVYEEMNIPVTEQVIQEFIAHEEIARDMAAYLDLYHKYEDHYGIPQILDGHVKQEIYQRLLHASFDERLSVVNLLLSGLNEMFRQVAQKREITDNWFSFLKQYRTRLAELRHVSDTSNATEQAAGDSGIYEQMLREKENEYVTGKRNGFLTREQEQRQRELLELLQSGNPVTQSTAVQFDNPMAFFDLARKNFSSETQKLEQLEARASAALEHAFDFMETAFLQGEEMVSFVTELSMGDASSAFLSENECKRYYRYNQELLLGSRQAELISEIKVGNVRARESIRE